MDLRNRFQGIDSASLCSPAGRYEIPIPTWFLAPIDCSKIPAQLRALKTSTYLHIACIAPHFHKKKVREFFYINTLSHFLKS
jgi:hypothetical protein